MHAARGEGLRKRQRLKSALWFAVGQIVDEESMRRSINATPQFIGALTELVWTQIGASPAASIPLLCPCPPLSRVPPSEDGDGDAASRRKADAGGSRERSHRPRELLPPRLPCHRHHRRRPPPRAQEPGPAAADGGLCRGAPGQGRRRQQGRQGQGEGGVTDDE